MIRARFYSPFERNDNDYRPIKFPPPHPYWCSGSNDEAFVLVAYADNVDQILEYWPEAEDIDYSEAEEYTFTSRFQKPDWFETD